MSVPIINITAEDRIENIECHLKLSAGPGAGKTRWLINHIKNVLHNSKRMGNVRKIACITYTNVAAETILERLGNNDGRVEVTTFHSFLYKNVVKPFLVLIPSKYELDTSKVDGHEEMPLYKSWLYEWKTKTGQTYFSDDTKIIDVLRDLSWQFDGSDNLILKTKKPYAVKIDNYYVKKDSYIEYKKIYWRKGILDHEDVLFFSYILIKQFPRILTVLRAKFPYLFIDEFQDTNPIQTSILKKIAEAETIVGVIGDIAQSIYGFQGADPSQFTSFTLPDIINYVISDNHRCSNQITNLLNTIRLDITQEAKRNKNGSSVTVLNGNKIWALTKAEELAGGSIISLTRNNITSNVMRDKSTFSIPKKKLIEELQEVDSNSDRLKTITNCIKATEFARQKRYKDALKEMSRGLKKIVLQKDLQKISLNILKSFLAQYDTYKSQSLLDYKTYVDTIYPTKSANFKAGGIKTFYENNSYEQIAISVNIKEDSSNHRTIHKAKGAEFENVMLILDKQNKAGVFEEENELRFLINPDLVTNEEHRIKYVAVSRARECLFINVPNLSPSTTAKLTDLGFIVVNE